MGAGISSRELKQADEGSNEIGGYSGPHSYWIGSIGKVDF